jgi:hypothetical protein
MARRAGMIQATSATSANMIATQPRTSDQYNLRESFHGLLLPTTVGRLQIVVPTIASP